MSAVTMHWAADYLGKPWRRGARGPDAFYCYGLDQALALRRLGVTLPEPAGGVDEPAWGDTLRQAMHQGWRLVAVGEGPRADDVVLMRNRFGDRHCGFMVEADGQLGVMHADGRDTERGPVGEVVFETLAQAMSGGYSRIEFWRHQ